MTATKPCPQEETPSLLLKLSDFGYECDPLRDEVFIVFREPGLEIPRAPARSRVEMLNSRFVALSHLDEVGVARVYENTLAEFRGFSRPGAGEARRPYPEFRKAAIAASRGKSSRYRPRSDRPSVRRQGSPFPGIEELLDMNISREGAIVAHISYPLSNPAWFIFDSASPVSFGLLAYAHAIAYQLTYNIDEEGADQGDSEKWDCPAGLFGVWGHRLDEFLYNGISRVSVHEGEVVFAEFACDC